MFLNYYNKVRRLNLIKLKFFGLLVFIFTPLAAISRTVRVTRTVRVPRDGLLGLVDIIMNTLPWVIQIIISLAVLYFIVGLIKIIVSRSEEDRKNARAVMINGLIIIFIMVTVWSLVAIINRTFRIDRVGPGSGSTTNTINIFR